MKASITEMTVMRIICKGEIMRRIQHVSQQIGCRLVFTGVIVFSLNFDLVMQLKAIFRGDDN